MKINEIRELANEIIRIDGIHGFKKWKQALYRTVREKALTRQMRFWKPQGTPLDVAIEMEAYSNPFTISTGIPDDDEYYELSYRRIFNETTDGLEVNDYAMIETPNGQTEIGESDIRKILLELTKVYLCNKCFEEEERYRDFVDTEDEVFPWEK